MPIPDSPPSPIEDLASRLSATRALRGCLLSKDGVVAGKDKLAANRAPPSIVIYPSEGGYDSPEDNVASLVDVDLKLSAIIWGKSLAQAWDLRQRLVQALREQGAGEDGEASSEDEAGDFFELVTEHWDTIVDPGSQGQQLEVVFSVRFSAAPTPEQRTGEVDSTALNPTITTLLAPLLQGDVVAQVQSTARFASAGNISIDGEQLSYTGLTPTSFTGISHGINGTTPVDHDAGVAVTLIP